MAREMSFVQSWDEVAPTLLIARSKSRRLSNSFKLDPIIEDESQGSKLLYKGVASFHLLFSGKGVSVLVNIVFIVIGLVYPFFTS
ncbi:hypothetical protein CR513_45477, partial [Mucuna pruriens]